MKHLYFSVKRISLLLFGILLIGSMVSCADDYNKEPLKENTLLSSITINEKYETYTLAVGDKYMLHYTIQPDNATDGTVVWVSGNEEVATVDSEGQVKARSVGETIITVKPSVGFAQEVVASIKIKVVEEVAYTEEINIINDEETLSLIETQSVQLIKQTVPEEPSFYLVEWESDDETIAKVDENGKVLGLSPGTAVITVKATDGTNKSASVTVTVKPVIRIESFTIDESHKELAKDAASILKYTIYPPTATVTALTWSSTNATVATVDKQGAGEDEKFVIRGLNYGETQLTASVTYGDGTTFEQSFDVSVMEGKVNEEFDVNIGAWGQQDGIVENGRLVIKREPIAANTNVNAKIKGTVTFYPSKYPILAMKVEMANSLNVRKKFPGVFFDIWNNKPRIGYGRYYIGEAAPNGNGKSYTRILEADKQTSDGAYYGYADLSNPLAFRLAVPGILNEKGIMPDNTTLGDVDINLENGQFLNVVTEPYAICWIKTFRSIEEYKAYMIEHEGVVFE